MHPLQFRYTRNFNIRYKKTGHLFQGRYKAILCEKDSYLLELSAYIHLNAVRAGLVEDPLDYRWCSYGTYMRTEADELVDTDFVSAQFSDRRKAAIKEYNRFVKNRMDQGHRDDLYELKDQRLLGGEGFVEDVRKDLNDEIPFVYDIGIAQIATQVSSVLGIPPDLVYSANRNRRGALGRSVAGYLARKLGGHKVKAVAEHFRRDPVVISQGIKGIEQKLKGDETFVGVITGMEKSLIRNTEKKYLVTYA